MIQQNTSVSQPEQQLRRIYNSVDAWIFDLDGTLVDSFESCLQAMNNYLAEYGAKVDAAWNRPHFSSTIEQVLLAVAKHCGFQFSGTLEQEVHKLESRIVQNAHLTRIYPGAVQCLRWLRKRGVRVGFITAGTHDEGWSNVAVLQAAYGNSNPGMIDLVVTNGDVEHSKPHPDSLFRCCEAWGISDCSRLVYVGDSGRDVQMMKQDGIDGYAIYVESTEPYASIQDTVPKPDLVLPDVHHLYSLFLTLDSDLIP